MLPTCAQPAWDAIQNAKLANGTHISQTATESIDGVDIIGWSGIQPMVLISHLDSDQDDRQNVKQNAKLANCTHISQMTDAQLDNGTHISRTVTVANEGI